MRLKIDAAVVTARAAGQPIVALETTVITHGLAYPDNVEVALAMESAVRAEGAWPATLGIVAGDIIVGFNEQQIEAFARAQPDTIAKCSRRDLPVLIGLARSGSLTVAGTMLVAHAAGIDIMATGGIGGVHRGHPFDVSADLLELGRTPVACVCAGVKSILDMKLTLEALETQGVPVVGLGTKTLPAFFCADSGLPLPAYVDDVVAAANVLASWRQLQTGNGMLITAPVPADDALGRDEAEAAIAQALREADEQGVDGSRVTPFVLGRVAQLTNGRSVRANKALLINNARAAARLAVAAGFGAAHG